MKLHLFVIECITQIYDVIENTLNIHKIKKMFQATTCFIL